MKKIFNQDKFNSFLDTFTTVNIKYLNIELLKNDFENIFNKLIKKDFFTKLMEIFEKIKECETTETNKYKEINDFFEKTEDICKNEDVLNLTKMKELSNNLKNIIKNEEKISSYNNKSYHRNLIYDYYDYMSDINQYVDDELEIRIDEEINEAHLGIKFMEIFLEHNFLIELIPLD